MPDENDQQSQIEYIGLELEKLEKKTLSAEAISAAVASGMTQAVSSPEFWDAGYNAMRQRTKSAAGGFLLDGIWSAVRRVMWFVLAGFIVYLAGGWSALVQVFSALFGDLHKP